MLRFSLPVVIALAACQPVPMTPSASASDGQASKLRAGMSENDAFGVFGPESGFERNPDNWDESCLSYAYGSAEDPRYVHARFTAGALSAATDGHTALCTYAAPDAPEV